MKIKNVLSCLLICTLGISNISYAAENVEEKSGYSFVDKEKDWQQLSSKLDSYGGVWEDFDYEDAVTTVIPGAALMGNGDVGVTSYGKAGEKTYLISKGDFWNAGDMETSAPFTENDKARRALTVGGLTIKKHEEEGNLSLTAREGVSVQVSSHHDNYVGEQVIDQLLEFSDTLEGWVSDVGQTGWLQIDLGEIQHIEKYSIYHHGAVREERKNWNTSDYTVSFSKDGETWETVEDVKGNTDNKRIFIFDEGIETRYMRIDVTKAMKNDEANPRVRIAEVEIFSDKEDPSIFDEQENLSLTMDEKVTATASSYHENFTPQSVINGEISNPSIEEEGWVSAVGKEAWIQIDLGEVKEFSKYVIYHHGSCHPDRAFRNTKAYTVEVSVDGENWTTIDQVENNTANYSERRYDTPISARFVKVNITEPNQNDEASPRARISEIELFEDANTPSIFYPEDNRMTETQTLSDPQVKTGLEINEIPVEIDSWVSATENILVSKIRSKGEEELNLDVSAWVKKDGSTNFQKDSGINDESIWASRTTYNAAKDDPQSWTSKAVIASTVIGKETKYTKVDEASSKMEVLLEPGEEIYVITAVGGGGQTYNNKDELNTEDPLKEAQKLLESCDTKEEMEELQKAHQSWWKDYWLKSYVDIGDEDFHRYYYGSLYYMGCTAREDTLAPGLYGVWITTDMARYQDDYHMNYNYMAPFYGMYSSNRYEGAYSLMQPILDYMPKAEKAAKTDLSRIEANYVSGRADLAEGIDDAVLYPVGLGPWGTYTENTYFNQTLNTLFAATIFMSYFEYTQDMEFLSQKAYPFLKKVANFYTAWCEKEELGNGEYRYNLWDGAHENIFNKNAGVSLGITEKVYEFLIQNAASQNASEEEKATWMDMYEHLAEVPVRTYTIGDFSKPVYALTEDADIIWPASASVNLEFVQPGDRLTFDSDPELLEIGRNTIEAKVAANSEIWGNINNTPKMFTHAIRVGYDPEETMEQFKKYNINKMEKNFTIQDENHGIEKAGGIEFINNMLLQSSNGIIKVFPNWTGEDAQFTTLREKGAFLVSSKMEQEEVQYIEITAETGENVEIVNPWEKAQVYDKNGKLIQTEEGTTVNTEEKTLKFETEKGMTYRIERKTSEPQEISTKVLEYAIELAEKADRDQVVQSVLDKFDAALEKAEELLEKVNSGDGLVTQEMIDESWQELIKTMQYLSFKQGDKTDLVKVIALAEEMEGELDSYLDEGKERFTNALEKARGVKEDLNAMQEEVNHAWQELLEAMAGLQKIPDKSELLKLLQKAEKVEERNYETQSYALLLTAYTDAKAVYEDPQTTVDSVEEAEENLRDALAKLIPAENVSMSWKATAVDGPSGTAAVEDWRDGNTQSKMVEKSVKTADSTDVTMFTAAMFLAAAAATVGWKKRKASRTD